jgi:hypothetical protein
MKTAEDIIDAVNKLTSNQISDLESIISRLSAVKDNKVISIDGLRSITNSMKELEAIREYFTLRIIHSLKRGNEI